MKKNLFLLLLILIISCNRTIDSKRKPGSVEVGKIDLIEVSRSIQDEIKNKKITAENCLDLLSYYEQKFSTISTSDFDRNQIEVDGKAILDEMFNSRVELHHSISSMSEKCKIKLKNVFMLMRSTEDLIGIKYYQDQQLYSDKLVFSEQKIPVYESEAYHPYHLGKSINSNGKFEFKNGDIMITKGISFVSSTISELASPRSLFSHIVFVHVDESTKEVTTIESYVGKGVGIYPIEEALKNENARILVLRAKDSKLASDAANYMFDRVQKLKAKKKFIPYDYALDFSENKKLSCEEVAFDAFKTASNGTFIIPETMSEVNLKDKDFLKRIGVKAGRMMVPSDMETDSRFEIVLDWTDYRIMRDSWRKDAVLGEIFRWSDHYNYSIKENFTSIAARVVWSTRYIPGLWNLMAHVSGLPADFTKDVPSKTIATMASLKSIGNILLPEITKADEDYFKLTGQWMSTDDLRKFLNTYRESHPKQLEEIYRD